MTPVSMLDYTSLSTHSVPEIVRSIAWPH